MMTNKLFNSSISSTDRSYLLIRDDPRFSQKKDFLENCWKDYAPYADPGFEQEISIDFRSRFWEMYLCCTLIHMGFEIVPKKDSEGPDIQIKLRNGQCLWIEATLTRPGTGADAVPEEPLDEVYSPSGEKYLLRFLNSIDTKHKRLIKYRSEEIVKPNDLFMVAVNGFFAHSSGGEIPYIVQALYGFGDYFATINIDSLQILNQGYIKRALIKKQNNSEVSANAFVDRKTPELSGVIYSDAEAFNLPPSFGSDFIFVHNPTANHPIPLGWLPVGAEYWVDGQTLRFKRYAPPEINH